MRKCLFLDRDGVVNQDIGYAYRPEQIEFVPGIFDLCKKFGDNGYTIVIVTNQSGIARGYFGEEDFRQLSRWMTDRFRDQQVEITDIMHCPHLPEITGPCDCRKPEPGMLLAAIKKYRIDPRFSMMVGDKESDMIAAEKAGIANRIFLQHDSGEDSSHATLRIHSLHDLASQMTDTCRISPENP